MIKDGKIIKGIGGFYYVFVQGSGIYECRARGLFRKQDIKPLVGDNVSIEVISEEEFTGNVCDILPRKNSLVRPALANIDQALVVFAVKKPQPNLNLLDRFLLTMEQQDITAVIGFNKTDLASKEEIRVLFEAYKGSGYECIFFSAENDTGTDRIRDILKGHTTTLAGPSGVGKSTLINLLAPEADMEVGEISRKAQRGKHTTRHSQLIYLGEESFIFDTPGFSAISSDFFELDTLKYLFPEFARYESGCRYAGCSHIGESDCGIKKALKDGEISGSRYSSYLQIYSELKTKKKY